MVDTDWYHSCAQVKECLRPASFTAANLSQPTIPPRESAWVRSGLMVMLTASIVYTKTRSSIIRKPTRRDKISSRRRPQGPSLECVPRTPVRARTSSASALPFREGGACRRGASVGIGVARAVLNGSVSRFGPECGAPKKSGQPIKNSIFFFW